MNKDMVRFFIHCLLYLAVVWLATVKSASLASDSTWGRSVGTEPIDGC